MTGDPDRIFNEIFDIMIEELREAARIDGTELGEYWLLLTSLRPRIIDCASKKFRDSWEQEIIDQHEFLKENFVIIEEESTYTVKTKYLEMK